MQLHRDEIPIEESVVRALVEQRLPEAAGLPLRPLGRSGSSNTLFRLGADLVVRLPRQPGGSKAIVTEARWSPHLAAALPVAVPEVVLVGEPGLGFPERWSVLRWIAGHTPTTSVATEATARDLADLVLALHEAEVPAAALSDPELQGYRGRALAAMDAPTRRNLAECRDLPDLDLDLQACERIWAQALATPAAATVLEPHWLHGDLLAENLLVRDDRLIAVLDLGGVAIGDPTVDLIVAWELLDPPRRAMFRSLLEVDEPTWRRGRAWALAIALMTFPYYWHSMPGRCAARLAMARAIIDDAAG